MESLLNVLKSFKRNAWMASVDLKDAFFTVPIHESYQKYFKFEWIDKVYKFLGMPNGYSDAMRIFTKILQLVYANLRQKGHLSVVFVDNLYLQRDTETECLENVEATIALLGVWEMACYSCQRGWRASMGGIGGVPAQVACQCG